MEHQVTRNIPDAVYQRARQIAKMHGIKLENVLVGVLRAYWSPTNSLFPDRSIRRLFQNKPNVEALVKMIEPNLTTHIDFERLVPTNRSLLPETLREQQADFLFSVPFSSQTAQGNAEPCDASAHSSSDKQSRKLKEFKDAQPNC